MSNEPEQNPDRAAEETSDPHANHVNLPEGAVVVGVVEAVSYLSPDGDTCYGFRWPEDMTYAGVLGLLELVKAQVVRHYHQQYPADLEDDD